jgi:tRNA G18 (ribose-2'-O)-methylase SpoU
MSKLKLQTIPNLADTSTNHQKALEDGPDHYRMWQRNVTDAFKEKTEEEISAALQATAHPFAVCFEHWIGDFNMATGIRNANGFNAKEIFYVGDKKWDRRAAVGVHNYTKVQWIPTIEEFKKLKEKYHIVGIDNVPGSCSIRHHTWQSNTLMVFGEEGAGLTPEMQSMCEVILHIDMYGSVRSFNCGTASGIVMYDFVKSIEDSYSGSEWDE